MCVCADVVSTLFAIHIVSLIVNFHFRYAPHTNVVAIKRWQSINILIQIKWKFIVKIIAVEKYFQIDSCASLSRKYFRRPLIYRSAKFKEELVLVQIRESYSHHEGFQIFRHIQLGIVLKTNSSRISRKWCIETQKSTMSVRCFFSICKFIYKFIKVYWSRMNLDHRSLRVHLSSLENCTANKMRNK